MSIVKFLVVFAIVVYAAATLGMYVFQRKLQYHAENKSLTPESVGIIGARPWLWIFPGAALAITVLCINFVGDGVRDSLDPREVARLR